MKSVTVTFLDSENIDSFKVNDSVMVNQTPGAISEITNPKPIPIIPPGTYTPDSIEMGQGIIVSGNVASLANKDGSPLVISSVKNLVDNYTYLDWIASFKLPGTKLNSLGVSLYGHFSSIRGQHIYIFNYTTNRWQEIAFTNIGITPKTVETGSLSTPENFISPTGQVQIRIYSMSSSSFTSYTDMLILKVG
jgi:hypothetical protein